MNSTWRWPPSAVPSTILPTLMLPSPIMPMVGKPSLTTIGGCRAAEFRSLLRRNQPGYRALPSANTVIQRGQLNLGLTRSHSSVARPVPARIQPPDLQRMAVWEPLSRPPSGVASSNPKDICPNTAHFFNGVVRGVNSAYADGHVEMHIPPDMLCGYQSGGTMPYWFY